MSENSDLQAWVARAEEDYVLARSALRRKKPLIYGATFHAQQCAEKVSVQVPGTFIGFLGTTAPPSWVRLLNQSAIRKCLAP